MHSYLNPSSKYSFIRYLFSTYYAPSVLVTLILKELNIVSAPLSITAHPLKTAPEFSNKRGYFLSENIHRESTRGVVFTRSQHRAGVPTS